MARPHLVKCKLPVDRRIDAQRISRVARQLYGSTLQMLCGRNDIYEYYHPEKGEKPTEAASIFGWSAALLIDLAIQETRQQQIEAGN